MDKEFTTKQIDHIDSIYSATAAVAMLMLDKQEVSSGIVYELADIIAESLHTMTKHRIHFPTETDDGISDFMFGEDE